MSRRLRLFDSLCRAESLRETRQFDAFTYQLIITTGTSKPHITAISKKITEVLKTNKIKVYGYEGRGSKDWVLIDLGEVVLNIMSSSARELYDLESLWDPNL